MDTIAVMTGRLRVMGNDRDNRSIQVRPNRPNMKITHARIAAFYRSFNALLDTGLLLIE